MANEEVLGTRKTLFVLVIVVGCFAVLWPRLLSPLILGNTKDQLKPNQFDRDAGCCDVMFESEMAVLALVNEVCSTVVGVDKKLSPMALAECRKLVNDTCGVDIVAFLKRNENVGKTTRALLIEMKKSNGSCLEEHFGVPVYNWKPHITFNSWAFEDTMKQERPLIRGGPPPSLRERGRAIPPGVPPPRPAPQPPHVRVLKTSPLSFYFKDEPQPPPIPGMRPPLGSPGGPVPAPKSSMGFVMPIYTICIIVFFVYTLSKIMFRRQGTVPYDQLTSDPQFRRRVFRDDSRSSPEITLGHRERDTIVTAISGLVAEVQQQMESSYAQNQQSQELQDNHTRPYTNGTVISDSTPIRIITSEYVESKKEKSPELHKEVIPEYDEPSPEKEIEVTDVKTRKEEVEEDMKLEDLVSEETVKFEPETKVNKEQSPDIEDSVSDVDEILEVSTPEKESTPESIENNNDLIENERDLIENLEAIKEKDSLKEATVALLLDAQKNVQAREDVKRSTPELLEEALEEDSPAEEDVDEKESPSVKVLGMETTAHSEDGGIWPRTLTSATPNASLPSQHQRAPHQADEVKSIFLETEIPSQSRVLVADCAERTREKRPDKSSCVVSGKMTLSLIQDEVRDTPERDLESTVDEFTTASALTQPAEKDDDDLSEEEIEEEIEIEEVEEEMEEEDEELPKKT